MEDLDASEGDDGEGGDERDGGSRNSTSDSKGSSEQTPTKDDPKDGGQDYTDRKGADSEVDSPTKSIPQGRGKEPLTKPRTNLFKRSTKRQHARGIVVRTMPFTAMAQTLSRPTFIDTLAGEGNPTRPEIVPLSLPMSTHENIEEHNGPTVAEVSTTRPTPPSVQGPVCEPEGIPNTLTLDTCNVDTPRKDTAEGELEVGGAKNSDFYGGNRHYGGHSNNVIMSKRHIIFWGRLPPGNERAWRDPLDQQYERIEPSQPGEKE